MESIKGTVERVLFSSEQTGYKVLRIKTPSGSPSIVTGEFGPEIVLDTAAEFHGDFKTHSKYGHQFRVSSYDITYNAEELASIRLFIDNIAPNIGPERSEAVIRHFGKDTIDVLDNHPEKLIDVDGVGKVSAQSLAEAWKANRQIWNENRQIYSLRAFLNALGIRERRVKKILDIFGGGLEAEEKIRENPYSLIDVEGFGFTTVDHIARKLNVPESSPLRLKAFILHLLERVGPENGHLYLERDALLELTNQYCTENGTTFIGKASLETLDINAAIANINKEEQKIVLDDGVFYSKRSYFIEQKSAELLSVITTEQSDLILLTQQTVDDYINRFEKENNIVLSEEQKQALYIFADKKVFVITGAAGSGKTTIIKAIVELTKRMRLRLTCMTPTGISAKKMAMTVNNEAYTIHRRLGFRGSEWIHNELNPYDTDVVILDEVSMLDQEVLYRLLSALDKRVHIVFVGDHNQLPSVGPGNVLKELIDSGEIPTIKLEKIFRQSEASDIIKAAHQVKNGNTDLELFKSDPAADVFFYRKKDTEEISKILIALAQKFKDERRLFQIITPRNDGPLGVEPLNKLLQDTLNPPAPHLAELNCGKFILRLGDRILVRKNDYENDIYNGDLGKIVGIESSRLSIKIDERIIDLAVDDLEGKISLGYILSVHKSQGQEYPYIILPFINQFGKHMLQRNLLYTAITRAKQKVIVIGHGSALERAINNASVIQRNTKLGERIKKCLQQKKKPSMPQSPEWHPNSVLEAKEQSLSETVESCLMAMHED